MLGPLYRSRGASHQGSNFDLEEAHLLRQQEGREKEKSIHDILKKASRFWLGLAALVLIAFIAISSLLSGRRTPQNEAVSVGVPRHFETKFESSPAPGSSQQVSREAGVAQEGSVGDHLHPAFLSRRYKRHSESAPVSSAAESAPQEETVEPSSSTDTPTSDLHYESHEESPVGTFEEEPSHEEWSGEEGEEWEAHVESEDAHAAFAEELHSERLHEREDFHESDAEHWGEGGGVVEEGFDHLDLAEEKQHPDEPHFVDLWDGVSHDELHLSKGLPGLRTPLYRLPFVEGQQNGTHVLGVHEKRVRMPRVLKVESGKRLPEIAGEYKMWMVPDGRPKPHLLHGRLLWRKTAEAAPSSDAAEVFLYYDHTHHTWVFSHGFEPNTPKPLAFLAHAAMLPIPRKNDSSFRRYGVPRGVHWLVRGSGESGAVPDPKVKVSADSASDDLQPLVLQRVYYSPEDGLLEDEEFLEESELLEEEMEEGEEGEDDHPHESAEPSFVPYGSRSMQQFLTHPRTNVYHTFELSHAAYDHAKIVQDPIAFITENPHPDFVGPERLAGHDHPPHPHPLRTSALDEDHEF